MTISATRLRQHLQAFDFKRLFIEELGWNRFTLPIPSIQLDGVTYTFTPVAQQGGMVVVSCSASNGAIPPTGARKKIDAHVTANAAYEHLLIFVDGAKTTSLWLWYKREDGKLKARTHTYRAGQMADALLQKLSEIAFDIAELDEDGQVSIAKVTGKVRKAFDVESVTKKFYDRFKTEHAAFLKFLHGVEDSGERNWYVSVMLNRLMFLYFIQKKGFLDGDRDYLQTKLAATQARGGNFYRDFLTILFFEGLACEETERDAETNALLGRIPYLNGGLFLPHSLEERYGDQIEIEDDAFERLFTFFDSYTWHLDERPLRAGNEINPDVLGYIFEKYINQKEMGAYYTKEDITGYICRNTILPFLFDKVGLDVRSVMRDVEPYIYDAVSTEDYLPTETEREYKARRERYERIKADFAAGKIASVDDLVTYNLDIEAFAEDWLRGLDDPVMLRRFYFECLTKLTVLDPTCGSGAFLFAAMNILEPLYDLALDRMADYADSIKYLDFRDELQRVRQHPNRRYFVLKSIIINNLYGVDIMEEAVEICKLRLFLKLVAQIEDVKQIEPLPDIDFNIRAGNTLVGFATRQEIEGRLFATDALKRKVEEADRALRHFRDLQTRIGVESKLFKQAKADIQWQLGAIRADLDLSLMEDYGLSDLDAFRASHKPFHWYVEFNSVLANGGFDVIIGNPPYVEYKTVKGEYSIRGFTTEECGDLYGYVMERSKYIQRTSGRFGMIVPVSIVSTDKFDSVRKLLRRDRKSWVASFAERPSKLFEGVEKRLTIWISGSSATSGEVYTARYRRWFSEEREFLMTTQSYVRGSDAPRLLGGSIPKIESDYEVTILRRLSRENRLKVYFKKTSSYIVYYTRKLRYFVQFFDFVPKITDAKGNRILPSELKEIYLPSDSLRYIVIAVLNSGLFFWFMTIHSDVRNLNKREIEEFPCAIDRISPEVSQQLIELGRAVIADFQGNSRILSNNYGKYGVLNIQSFQPRLSKPIIDEIDRVLARHYGFTEEELDFIINYDIKYRMGRDVEADGEGDGE